MIEFITIMDLYEPKEILGTTIYSLKNDVAQKLFQNYSKQIDMQVGLELMGLDEEIKVFAKDSINNEHLLEYLKNNYNDVLKSYLRTTQVIPVEFHTNYRDKSEEPNFFFEFIISEISDSIRENNKIPEIEEEDFLEDWLNLDILFYSKLFLRKKITEYSKTSEETRIEEIIYSSIFIDKECYYRYKKMLRDLNVVDSNGKPKRGFFATAKAIFNVDPSYINTEKKLFRYGIFEREYVDFLNQEYDLGIPFDKIPNYKLSNGGNKEKDVRKFY